MTTTTQAQTSSTNSKDLVFPLSTFAKLSPHPFLLTHLSTPPSVRPGGRLPSEFRPPHVNTGSLTHAEGSAVVRCGDTTVVAGVRGEILLVSDAADSHGVDNASDEDAVYNAQEVTTADARKRAEIKAGYRASQLKELDLLVPNIELATGCSPAFLPGQPPSTLAQGLSTRLYTLLHESQLLDLEDLKIWFTSDDNTRADGEKEMNDEEIGEEGNEVTAVKAYWTLYIDILFISLDGNAFDAAWGATLAALRSVRLPHAYWDGDAETVLCSDELAEFKTLNLRGLPIACTFVVFATTGNLAQGQEKDGKRQRWVLADPDAFEEGLCNESVTIVVDCSLKTEQRKPGTKLLGISKVGGTGIGKMEMKELVSMAEKRWVEWDAVLGYR